MQAAIEEVRNKIREETELTAEKLMAKLETALAEAKEAKQFNAVARILELQGKLSGLLIEHMHHLHEQVHVTQALEAARARAFGEGPVIEKRAESVTDISKN